MKQEAEQTGVQNVSSASQSGVRGIVLILACGFGGLAIVALWYFNYPFPNTKAPSIAGFITIFLKEIIAICLVTLVAVSIILLRFTKARRER